MVEPSMMVPTQESFNSTDPMVCLLYTSDAADE